MALVASISNPINESSASIPLTNPLKLTSANLIFGLYSFNANNTFMNNSFILSETDANTGFNRPYIIIYFNLSV